MYITSIGGVKLRARRRLKELVALLRSCLIGVRSSLVYRRLSGVGNLAGSLRVPCVAILQSYIFRRSSTLEPRICVHQGCKVGPLSIHNSSKNIVIVGRIRSPLTLPDCALPARVSIADLSERLCCASACRAVVASGVARHPAGC